MGAYHGATLAQRLPGARLTAVADPAPDAAEKLAAALGASSAYTDPGQALADPAGEAGGVPAPAPVHPPLFGRGPRAGEGGVFAGPAPPGPGRPRPGGA